MPDEEPTQQIAYESLAEVAAKWREQNRLEEKRLRSVGSTEQTQPLPKGR